MKTVIGLFDRLEVAQQVVRALKDTGFRPDDISLIARDLSGDYARFFKQTPVENPTVAGAQAGAILGSLGGLLMGLGSLSLPGIGLVLAAGPLVGMLAGAGIGAAAGGLAGALIDMGISDQEARLYSEGIRRGGSLVVVHADEAKAELAMTIMNRHDPMDLNHEAENWQRVHSSEHAIPETGAAAAEVTDVEHTTLDYGDLDEDLHKYPHLMDNLYVKDDGVDTGGSSRFDRDGQDVPSTGDVRVDRSSDVLEPDGTTIPTTSGSQDNPFVMEGNLDASDAISDHTINARENEWREHFHSHLDHGQQYYGYFLPAYEFGYEMRHDRRFHGQSDLRWEQVEEEIHQEWIDRSLPGDWDLVAAAVRYAWGEGRVD